MTELTALRDLKRGSQEALAWFIQKYGAYVSTVVTNIIQASMSPADVEEVTADVFFALWEQAGQLKLSSVKSYLAGIARNKAKNKLRELGCTVPLNDDLILIDEISPEDMYARKEAAAIVRKTVEKMKEPEREILLRFYYFYQSVEEISAQMGLNPSTVKTKLHRSRLILKTALINKLT